jgi:hypothetical protein
VKEKERFEVRTVEEVEEKSQELFRVKEKERFEVKFHGWAPVASDRQVKEKERFEVKAVEEEVEVSEVGEEVFEDRLKVFEKERIEVL